MVVIPATRVALWYLVVVVTELGHWFSLVSFGILLWELAAPCRLLHFITIGLCLLSIGLYLMPLVRAVMIATKLPTRLAGALGGKKDGFAPPLRLGKLWNLARTPIACEEEREFITADGSALVLRIYDNGSAAAQPCIVMIHGGGWNSGDPSQMPEWNRQLAALGYRVASMAYRLAPKFHWPAQKEDVAAALAYLKAHAAELRIDPARFIFFGRSAGGQIALAAAYAFRDPAIRGCIASYPPTDMNFSYWTGEENDMLGSRPLVRALMGGPPESAPDLYRDASPLDLVGSDTPPTLLIHGCRDEVVWVRHSERLRDRLVRAGRPVFLLKLPWATHGFDAISCGPGGQLELYAISWLLRRAGPGGGR